MVGKEILTGREREKEYETDWDEDKKYLGFIKRQRYKFFFLNLIPKRRRFATDIKINNRLKRRRFGIVELKFRNPTFCLILSCAVSPSASAFLPDLSHLLKPI